MNTLTRSVKLLCTATTCENETVHQFWHCPLLQYGAHGYRFCVAGPKRLLRLDVDTHGRALRSAECRREAREKVKR